MEFLGPTVLVADDDVLSRRRLRRDLMLAGARVAEARDGEEAVRQVVEGASFDLVLLDLDMPRMDGATAAWLLRQKDRVVRGGVVGTVVGMTEGAPPADEDAVWFDALLAKPLARGAIDRLLERCREPVVPSPRDCALQVTG